MASSNSVVNWGFLSTAEIATKVYQAVQVTKNARVYAVASRSVEKAEEWKKAHPNVEKAYGTYDELLADPNVHAVYIPLPTAHKVDWAIKSANAGKHVLLEKPLPTNLADLDRIIEACNKNNVNFMDGTMWLHSNRTQKLEQERFQSLGKITRINAAFTFGAPNEEWLQGGNGRTNKEREPQGCLECGWYPIGAILFVKNWTLPTKVQVHHWVDNKVDTVVYLGASMWFEDGTWSTFDCGYLTGHRCFYEVAGANGTLLVDDLTGGQGKTGDFHTYFGNYVGSGYYKVDDVLGKETVVNVEPCNHTSLMLEQFSTNVLNKTVDSKWARISVVMQTALNAVFESYQKKGEAVYLKK